MMGDKAASLLVEMFHIFPSTLRPDARLAEDLGIDGEDAKVFFAELRARHGTDFSELDASWSRHFRSETEVWLDDINRLGIIALVLLVVVAASWFTQQAGATVACMGCFARAPKRTPIFLQEVSDAVSTGRWEARDRALLQRLRLNVRQ